MKEEIKNILQKIVAELGLDGVEIQLDIPKDLSHGDLTTNIAMVLFGNQESRIKNDEFKNPRQLAEKIALEIGNLKLDILDKVEVAGPGFINFWYSKKQLGQNLEQVLTQKDSFGRGHTFDHKKIMVEFAHPNTHKEMHIGHMRTLITGEALSRIFEAEGAEVFRANYQGDIGPHVAKALFGLKKLMEEENLTIDQISAMSHAEKAHILGRGYARGSKDYEENQTEIDEINKKLYEKSDSELNELYETTRQWSLDYYDEFYRDFYTTFDQLFFESQMADRGKEIIQQHLGKVFVEDEGAIIFPGKQYGLHNRVFITSKGTPTYEGKEMANAEAEFEAFPFDKKIHVVGSEQAGYFKVVFKALEMIDPQKYEGRQHHVSMGMVQLTDRKMSSRTGDVLRVDWLVDEVRRKVSDIIHGAKINKEANDEVINQVTIGAIKYSVLKVGTGQDVAFDINQSVSLDGNSGPYLQYTYARTRSVLAKVKSQKVKGKSESQNVKLEIEEANLLRMLVQFPTIVQEAAEKFAPNVLTNYLFELTQLFNLFYQKHKVIGSEKEEFRIGLTTAVGQIIKNGLHLLGIQAPYQM